MNIEFFMILFDRKVGDLLKKHTTLVVICTLLLIISIVGISYAMVTTSLDIKGNMTMASANWDVHFADLQNAKIIGTAVELSKPYLVDKSTSIVNINVKLQQATDAVSYLFNVINGGGIDAEISSYQINKPICTGTGNNAQQDAKMVCDNIKYKVTYEDGTKINIGDTLKTKEQRTLKLELSFSGKELPVNEVNISNLSIALSYSQM